MSMHSFCPILHYADIGAGKARITLPTAFDRESDAVVSTAGDVFVEVSLVDKNGSAAGQITFLLNLKSIAPIPYVNATVKRGTPNSIDAVAKFKVGEVVEGQFKGGVDWYGAVVKAVNIIDHAVTYHLVYDDGDEEYEMEGSKIRPFVPIPAKSPAESPAKSSSEEPQSVVLTPPSVLLYSIGDPVEALFDRGDEWYLGNVKAINAKGNFDLLYEDGDIEDDVSVGRMRVPVPPDVITVPTADNIIFSGDIPAVTESSPKNDTPVCACGREIPFGYCEECNALLEATAAKAESDRLSAEAKAAQEAATTANRSKAASRRSSLKSSEDAFLDNYLDELSDDEGGLNAGPAVYGNLASSKGSIVLKSASSDVNGGVGEYKINADDVPKSRSEKKAEEGDYNEDFES